MRFPRLLRQRSARAPVPPRSLGIGPLADDAATDRGGQPGGQRRGGGRRRSRAPGGGRIGPAAEGGRGAAPRRAADHDQGFLRRRGNPLDRRGKSLPGPGARCRRGGGGAAAGGGGGDPRQVERPGLRRRFSDLQRDLRRHQQPVRPRPHARRLVGGRRGGGGERDERLRARLRSRQLDPLAGPCLRPVRPEDDLEPRSPLRPRAAGPRAAHGPQPRPRRGGAPRPFGGGSRPRAQRPRRGGAGPRAAAPDLARGPSRRALARRPVRAGRRGGEGGRALGGDAPFRRRGPRRRGGAASPALRGRVRDVCAPQPRHRRPFAAAEGAHPAAAGCLLLSRPAISRTGRCRRAAPA